MERKIERTKIGTFIVVGMLVFLACGCANLSAIRDFADISSTIADNNSLTIEYVEWPLTQKRYFLSEQYKELDNIANQRSQQEKMLLLRHSIIEEYMKDLGQLASDDVINNDTEIDDLGNASKEAKFINDKEQEACQSITKLLLKASTDGWRQAKLKKLVKESNNNIQVIIKGLVEIANEGFLGDVQDEREAIRKYYEGILRDSNDPAGKAALNEWRETRLDSLSKKEDAIKLYSLSLKKIAEGHQKLYEHVNLNKIYSKEFIKQLKVYTKDLQKSYKAIISM